MVNCQKETTRQSVMRMGTLFGVNQVAHEICYCAALDEALLNSLTFTCISCWGRLTSDYNFTFRNTFKKNKKTQNILNKCVDKY